ncbi:DUF3397 family protein [Nicoliella lavandulae]|uniref:DUF3397 family protein n=1 Tax=Nicoliella lavandulae TaxID=3082954 RepID=UPI0035A0C0F1
MQIVIIILISLLAIFVKRKLSFKFLSRIKPIDFLLPFWGYFTYLNTIDTTHYTFLPWLLIPFVLFMMISCGYQFIHTGDVDVKRLIMLLWRICDIVFPFVWIISIFVK